MPLPNVSIAKFTKAEFELPIFFSKNEDDLDNQINIRVTKCESIKDK